MVDREIEAELAPLAKDRCISLGTRHWRWDYSRQGGNERVFEAGDIRSWSPSSPSRIEKSKYIFK